MLSLKNVLRLNAASCLVFGVLFLLCSRGVALFLGGEAPAPADYIVILGAALILNGVHLIWTSTLRAPAKALILYFALGDFLWVAASLGLVWKALWITTFQGQMMTTLIAVMVGFFCTIQILKVREGY